jgi:hypothetical protein
MSTANRQRAWWIGALALAAIWAIASLGMWIARRQTMTAEKTVAYVHAHPLASKKADERRAIIENVADRVNHLTFEERRKFRLEKDLRVFYESMTNEERSRYLDLTLPKGIHQAIQAFNEMPAEKRRRLVQRAVNDLQRAQADLNHGDLDKAVSDENVKKIIDRGIRAYWTEASAAAKIDIQPLIEQIQSLMQGSR